jgi:hypothetical protein
MSTPINARYLYTVRGEIQRWLYLKSFEVFQPTRAVGRRVRFDDVFTTEVKSIVAIDRVFDDRVSSQMVQ